MNELNPLYMFLYLIIKEKPRIGLRSWSLESDAAADVCISPKKISLQFVIPCTLTKGKLY